VKHNFIEFNSSEPKLHRVKLFSNFTNSKNHALVYMNPFRVGLFW